MGVVPRWAGGGHLGGLMVEIEKSLRWREIYWPKVSIAASSVQIGQGVWAVGVLLKLYVPPHAKLLVRLYIGRVI